MKFFQPKPVLLNPKMGKSARRVFQVTQRQPDHRLNWLPRGSQEDLGKITVLRSALVVASFAFMSCGFAQAAGVTAGHVKVGIEEKLGHEIPMNLAFRDERGKDITLGQIADGKPLIIDMAYYECPGICDVVLGNLDKMVKAVPQVLGQDFRIATISFNPYDKPADALKKKNQFWGALKDPASSGAWRFLTGDSSEIHQLTDALGFYFQRDKYGMFMHPTALIFVSGNGQIVRYIQGTDYAEADVRMALREAKQATPADIITSSPQVCFSHDPAGYKLTDDILRVGGVGTLIFIAGFLYFAKSKKKSGQSRSPKS